MYINILYATWATCHVCTWAKFCMIALPFLLVNVEGLIKEAHLMHAFQLGVIIPNIITKYMMGGKYM